MATNYTRNYDHYVPWIYDLNTARFIETSVIVGHAPDIYEDNVVYFKYLS